jgi:uncharacterized membrane protein YgcG
MLSCSYRMETRFLVFSLLIRYLSLPFSVASEAVAAQSDLPQAVTTEDIDSFAKEYGFCAWCVALLILSVLTFPSPVSCRFSLSLSHSLCHSFTLAYSPLYYFLSHSRSPLLSSSHCYRFLTSAKSNDGITEAINALVQYIFSALHIADVSAAPPSAPSDHSKLKSSGSTSFQLTAAALTPHHTSSQLTPRGGCCVGGTQRPQRGEITTSSSSSNSSSSTSSKNSSSSSSRSSSFRSSYGSTGSSISK